MDIDKDVKLIITINKMLNIHCLAVGIGSLQCPYGKDPCDRCPYNNNVGTK